MGSKVVILYKRWCASADGCMVIGKLDYFNRIRQTYCFQVAARLAYNNDLLPICLLLILFMRRIIVI